MSLFDQLAVDRIKTGAQLFAGSCEHDREEAVRQLAATDLPFSSVAARLKCNVGLVERVLAEDATRAARHARVAHLPHPQQREPGGCVTRRTFTLAGAA